MRITKEQSKQFKESARKKQANSKKSDGEREKNIPCWKFETAELLQVQKFLDKHSYYAESTKYKLCL